jgi:hypothetical protein
MITKVPVWMEQPALYWNLDLGATTTQENTRQSSCVYWDWFHRRRGDDGEAMTTTTTTTMMVTYGDLMATAALTASYLKSDTFLPSSHSDQKAPLIVVVAIPEGPWLPLAILVVHALNAMTKAILVPLEPSEAKEHNRRILQDVQPTLVLGVADTQDFDRLEELLSSVGGDDLLGDPTLVDFPGLVQDIWRDQDGDGTTWWYEFCKSIDDDGSESWTLQQWIDRGVHYLNGDINNDIKASSSSDTAQISHIVYTS